MLDLVESSIYQRKSKERKNFEVKYIDSTNNIYVVG